MKTPRASAPGRNRARFAALLRQRDIGAAEYVVSAQRHGLLVAGRAQRHVGIEAHGADGDLKIAAATAALQRAGNVAAGLRPGPGHLTALVDDIGPKVELVSIAGAGQRHRHVGARYLIARATADAFTRAVVQRDRAAAGPVACHAGERASRLSVRD